MKKGFILPIIFIVITLAIGFYVFNTFARSPSAQTQKTAIDIVKYPNAQNWQIKNRKNVCFFATDSCTQPTVVTFQSNDTWNQVYFFYVDKMREEGWQTKSLVVTSVPTSVNFTNEKNCNAELTAKKQKYTFRVTCPD